MGTQIAAGGTEPTRDGYPEILEIRVHGVANTPPAQMLEVEADKVKRAHGDELGSFWTRDLDEQDRCDHISVVEAYSWGALARTGASALAVIGQVFVHVGWLFILPFGLCNTAYWMRPIPTQLENAKRWEPKKERIFARLEKRAKKLDTKRKKLTAQEQTLTARGNGDEQRLRRIERDDKRLANKQLEVDQRRSEAESPPEWRGGPGAATTRVFGLVLTLIYATAFLSIAVDVVAVQCFTADRVCATLPSFLDGLREIDRGARAALFSLTSVAAVLVIYLIARRGRVSWEPSVNAFAKKFLGGAQLPSTASKTSDPTAETATIAPDETHGTAAKADGSPGGEPPVGRPILATPGFWTRARTGPTSERLHFAAVLALVLLLLCWDAIHPVVASCFADDRTGDRSLISVDVGCVIDSWGASQPMQWIALAGLPVALALLVWAVIAVARATTSIGELSDKGKRAGAAWCLSLAAVSYVLYVLAALLTPMIVSLLGSTAAREAQVNPRFVGLIVTPTALLAIGLGLTFLMLALGTQANLRRTVWFMIVIGIAYGVSVAFTSFAWWVFFAVGAIALILHFVSPLWENGRPRVRWYRLPDIGWRGLGVVVAMLAALLLAMLISSLLVLGIERWMDPGPVPEPVNGHRVYPDDPPAEVLVEPTAYARYAVVLSVIVLAMLVLLAIVFLKLLTRLPRYTRPALIPRETEGAREERSGEVIPKADYPELEPKSWDRAIRQVAIARRTAALLHRGEPLLGWIAALSAIGFLTLVSPVGYDWIRDNLVSHEPTRVGIREASVSVLAAVAVALVALVASHASRKHERPLAVFWDVICFFPRAGHPFAPPCYAERAVPELTRRIAAWFERADEAKPDGPTARRRATPRHERAVLIAAHSMGSVVAAASIFALTDNTEKTGTKQIERLALLTYGSQLRAFFSRFFPDVLGPFDLGIRGTRGPSLFMRDPWMRQVRLEWPEVFTRSKPSDRSTTPKTGWLSNVIESGEYHQAGRRSTGQSRTDSGQAFDLSHLLGYKGLLGHKSDRPVRWISLWRRTDFLGFPVWSHNERNNPIDRGASEYVPNAYLRRVMKHDYLGTAQYFRARCELASRLRCMVLIDSTPSRAPRRTRRAMARACDQVIEPRPASENARRRRGSRGTGCER